MPAVAGRASPEGSPIATAWSPTCTSSESPRGSGVSARALVSTWRTARAGDGAEPTTRALSVSLLESATSIAAPRGPRPGARAGAPGEGGGDEARAATESARALHATRYRSVPVRAGLGRVKPPLRLARARRSVGISEHPDPEERHQEPR